MVAGDETKAPSSLEAHSPTDSQPEESSQPHPTNHPSPSSDVSPGDLNGESSTSPHIKKPSRRSNIDELKSSLALLGLDTKGKKDTLFKRLLKYVYKVEEPSPPITSQTPPEKKERTYDERLREAQENWRSFLCFDVEATCRGGKEFDWPNEIIEFPVVLLRWVDVPAEPDASDPGLSVRTIRRLERMDTFHTYIKPTWQPILSEFCTSLTGITQEMVDAGPTFPDMLGKLEIWLDKHDLRDEDGRLKNAVWVTDGPWDLRDFIPKQLHITRTEPTHPPYFFGQYLNIKQAVQTVLSEEWARSHSPPPPSRSATKAKTPIIKPLETTIQPVVKFSPISTSRTMTKQAREGTLKGPGFYFPIPGQLVAMGLGDFEGRQHSGLDDAINISRILIAMSERPNVLIHPNARTPDPKHMKKWPWMGSKPGIVKFEDWMSIPKGAVVNGKSYGGHVGEGEKVKEGEWRIMEDAAGRFKAVKVQIVNGETAEKGAKEQVEATADLETKDAQVKEETQKEETLEEEKTLEGKQEDVGTGKL